MKYVLSLMIIIVYILFFPPLIVSIEANTSSLAQSQSLSYGKTIVSPHGVFELGFFNLGNPSKIYLGIWYKNISIQNVVWVANGGNPIKDSSSILKLNSSGNLVLTHNNKVVWCTSSSEKAQNPVAELLDSGNLVIRDENGTKAEEYLWQSFDYPSNTMLLEMKVGCDLKRNHCTRLLAWKSDDDPTSGDLSWGFTLHPYPEIFMMKGTKKYHRLGPWNGLRFSGRPLMTLNDPIYHYEFVFNKEEVYYKWSLKQTSLITKVVLNQTTQERRRYVWSETDNSWQLYSTMPEDYCDHYGVCGANTYCTTSASPMCECLKGFKPKSPEKWNSMDWSQGCVLKHPLSCKDKLGDGFVLVEGLKVPDTNDTVLDETIDLEQCRTKCLSHCSCMAYTNSNISGEGSGCVIWFGDLFDIKMYPAPESGQSLYIRLHASQIESIRRKKNIKIIVASIAAILGVILAIYFVYRKNISAPLPQNGDNKCMTRIVATTIAAISGILSFCNFVIYRVRRNIADNSKTKKNIERQLEDLDVPLFDLLTISTATKNFSLNNKIGQGGFGPVYKGKLVDGREIAVKRLSSSSGQGITEFITEVKLIAKLQHRNLVKLLGCCFRGQENLLVYEYMLNGNLDSFIFDHEIKASNVLLDEKLNPKISDFGMARAFGGDQTEGNTNRVVGTYGYMAPEYAVDGLFSIKSDIFSFGILLLEIISGNKNRALCHGNQTLNLVGYAWTLWKEQNAIQLIDSSIKDSCVIPEVLRCIHVSLLCVQQYPKDRPTMTSVIQMLGNEMEMVEPKEPGFFPCTISDAGNLCSNLNQMISNDELTITSLSGR